MRVRRSVGFGLLDRLGQETITTAPAPVAPTTVAPTPVPAPTTTPEAGIPVVVLGPIRITNSAGHVLTGARATIRTPARVIKQIELPSGVFQASIDKIDFDQGASVIFGASGYGSLTIPAAEIYCVPGTRVGNTVTVATPPNCQFPTPYYLLRAGEAAPATPPQVYPIGPVPAAPAPSPYYVPPQAAPAPSPYYPPQPVAPPPMPAYAPPQPAYPPPAPPSYGPPPGYYRPRPRPWMRRPVARPAPAAARPVAEEEEDEAPAAAPSAALLARQTDGGLLSSPWVIAGGIGLVVVTIAVIALKS